MHYMCICGAETEMQRALIAAAAWQPRRADRRTRAPPPSLDTLRPVSVCTPRGGGGAPAPAAAPPGRCTARQRARAFARARPRAPPRPPPRARASPPRTRAPPPRPRAARPAAPPLQRPAARPAHPGPPGGAPGTRRVCSAALLTDRMGTLQLSKGFAWTASAVQKTTMSGRPQKMSCRRGRGPRGAPWRPAGRASAPRRPP
jgi:hypothetical protein